MMIHFEYVTFFFIFCFTAYEATFLLQHDRTKHCLYQNPIQTTSGWLRFVVETYGECNKTNWNFRWLWTKFGQLLHWETLECMSDDYYSTSTRFYRVVLRKCRRYHQRQSWECAVNNKKYIRRWVYLTNSYLYMYYYHGQFTDYVTTSFPWRGAAQWRRYDTQEDVCSQGNLKSH